MPCSESDLKDIAGASRLRLTATSQSRPGGNGRAGGGTAHPSARPPSAWPWRNRRSRSLLTSTSGGRSPQATEHAKLFSAESAAGVCISMNSTTHLAFTPVCAQTAWCAYRPGDAQDVALARAPRHQLGDQLSAPH